MNRPQPVESPNLESLRSLIEEYFDLLESDRNCDDTRGKIEALIPDEAIEALYGSDAWNWINSKID